ncbi:ABC transporter permease [Paraburkholderia sp. J67]|uniref:ABC transporter permease n=1 Tax=Paraburkholderia sp. J67 TaxID=2805435 RepID=UPI002ABD6C7F|nr:ABC transporter permease [Paraburkholderia sp. J67]
MNISVSASRTASRTSIAFRDIVDGVTAWPVWSALGWQDIRQRYRRSALGPFWITLTMLVTIAGMGPLYGALLKQDVRSFVPYLALGIITWGLISTLILEGGSSFVASEGIIRSVKLPLTLHILRGIYRNLIIFFHNVLAYVPIMLYAGIVPKLEWLLAIPGLLLIVVAAFPAGIILGIFCTRFRDMQPIVASVVQLAFFLTPILWKPEALGTRAYIAHFNPLYMFMELVRGPIYGTLPDSSAYLGAILVTVGLYVVAIPLFIRFRSRVAFWI